MEPWRCGGRGRSGRQEWSAVGSPVSFSSLPAATPRVVALGESDERCPGDQPPPVDCRGGPQPAHPRFTVRSGPGRTNVPQTGPAQPGNRPRLGFDRKLTGVEGIRFNPPAAAAGCCQVRLAAGCRRQARLVATPVGDSPPRPRCLTPSPSRCSRATGAPAGADHRLPTGKRVSSPVCCWLPDRPGTRAHQQVVSNSAPTPPMRVRRRRLSIRR